MTRSSTKKTDCSLTKVVHNPTTKQKKTRSKTFLTARDDPNKSLAQVAAEEIQLSLNPKYPSFIKMMLSSHVSYCFWLGLPAKFCTSNLPKEDIDMTLLDEDGKQHSVKCLPRKFGLSGGWGGFAKAHKLAPGDALVFQLVEATKFKVYIVRENGLAGDTPEEGSELADHTDAKEKKTTKKFTRKRKLSHAIPPLLGENQDIDISFTGCNEMETTKRPRNKHIRSYPSVPLHGEDQNITLSLAGAKKKTANKPRGKRVKLHPPVPVLGTDQHITLPLPLASSRQAEDHGIFTLPLPLASSRQAEDHTSEEVIDRNVTLPIASLRKPEDDINEEVLDRNIVLPLASMRQPEDHSSEEVIDSEVLERIKLSDSINEIQDVTNLENFTIIVNGFILDSMISENDRTKYYELCRSQKSYLHKHITPGLNNELIAGIIRETVDIADAIRASKLSTPKDEYKAWEKRLIGFKHLGMNVEFLLSRLDILQKLALESEDALDYNKAMIRENHAKEELSTVEKKILELIRFEKEVQTLKIDAQRHAAFQSVVSSPW